MSSPPERLLRRLEWRLGRRLDGRLQGAYRTVWHGTGIDFTDLRAYTPEDDVRHIDWNVTARLDEPFVRQYTEDRELTAWLVVDKSASMRFGGHEGKDSVATELAVSLARLVSQGGNRVGAILFDNAVQRVIPPRTGRDQILRIAQELLKPSPVARRPKRSPEPAATTDLTAMLNLAAKTTATRRSLIFLMSDFIGDPGWDRPLGVLTHRHEVVVIRVVDPAELDLPDLGLILVEDAETGEQLLVDTSDPLLRDRLAGQVDAREAELAGAMRRAGVAAHRITTDQDLLSALVQMVRTAGQVRR
ncbi:uncharacterized protein (DUF58 family) [Actinoplanes octamycinicus]|uniref:Uncharacterized protein (DUF58 family) n=1 Tax=Actinoplanes octamycinicus TaxID=135948 RepID=A0A7W7M4K1_9ACTN|nr:DUF58 domain-containing protein [Actinoplanes octamycinicus]MBB4736698.1 uncharacterized protein (DUF58 family) [Actinoplanes octamycinicus]GIE60466.1 hypothetical protein Aoc01nite_58680 [Actinoplanes octamycinicus]